ncbi:MAG: acyl-CoA thioesterase [Parvularculaceae bacterium]
MKFSESIDAFVHDGTHMGTRGGTCRGRVADNWLQGRTVYGGMTAALCLEAAQRAVPGLPPLRSAQVSFIGPAEGDLEITAAVLRQGKSVTFVNADLVGEKGLAARTVFAFGAARASIFATHFTPAPELPGPDRSAMFFPPDAGPSFARNFDVRLAKGGVPLTGSTETDHFLWVRHQDDKATSISALLALADMPPPAVFPMFPHVAPISSMTWALNFLTDHPSTDDGWWLLESRAENAAEGYSSQDMFVWNRRGEPVIAGRQSVAIFL